MSIVAAIFPVSYNKLGNKGTLEMVTPGKYVSKRTKYFCKPKPQSAKRKVNFFSLKLELIHLTFGVPALIPISSRLISCPETVGRAV